jgi:transposase
MRDVGLYERILGLLEPWEVTDVELRTEAGEVIVEVGLRQRSELACPRCGGPMAGYDHRRRRWRHLDTCQYKTIIEADVPRGKCPTHGCTRSTFRGQSSARGSRRCSRHSRSTGCGRHLNARWPAGWGSPGPRRTGS